MQHFQFEKIWIKSGIIEHCRGEVLGQSLKILSNCFGSWRELYWFVIIEKIPVWLRNWQM